MSRERRETLLRPGTGPDDMPIAVVERVGPMEILIVHRRTWLEDLVADAIDHDPDCGGSPE